MTDYISREERKLLDSIAQIARVCYEANRAYCASMGDDSQPAWNEAQEWQRASALDGVTVHLRALAKGDPPIADRDTWLVDKPDGECHSPEKDATFKGHAYRIPYASLPFETRFKDHLFEVIASAFWTANQSES